MADSGSDFGMVMTELVYVRVVRSLRQQHRYSRCESIHLHASSFTDVVVTRIPVTIHRETRRLFSFVIVYKFKYVYIRLQQMYLYLLSFIFSTYEISPEVETITSLPFAPRAILLRAAFVPA